MFGGVESLAGVFHPHAIAVQDFSLYSLIMDVRSLAEFEDDHIPGAVRVEPPAVLPRNQQAPTVLPDEIEALIASGESILVYCGQGGLDSQPIATALRSRGWTVDVLPGGWINYRRWVQAGIEVLPRLIPFRILSASLGSEGYRGLRALRSTGQQVLDVEGLCGRRFGSLQSEPVQPSQAFFESHLLQAIRELDPRSPVWVTDLGSSVGALTVPTAMQEALTIAPTTVLQATLAERIRRWREDEPALRTNGDGALLNLASHHHPDLKLPALGRGRSAKRASDELLAGMLQDGFDAIHAERLSAKSSRRLSLPPIAAESLAPRALRAAVRAWMSSGTASRLEISR